MVERSYQKGPQTLISTLFGPHLNGGSRSLFGSVPTTYARYILIEKVEIWQDRVGRYATRTEIQFKDNPDILVSVVGENSSISCWPAACLSSPQVTNRSTVSSAGNLKAIHFIPASTVNKL